jgi:spermidine synthase
MPAGPEALERRRLGPTLFASAAFASAFLIFLVQPMVGKRILPWFGGVPSVWILCLAFYQTALFAGYAYAHWLIRSVRPARQLLVHALVCTGALLALPVLPGERWKPAGAVEPSAAILAILAVHVSLPFVALAATGPLVQAWFARRYPSRSPYPLYAVSNLGSFLALAAYPFLVEPRLSLSRTGQLWSLAFAATAAAVLACAALARRAAPSAQSPAASGLTPERTRPARVALWLLLPGCAVVILMGVTNALTLDVASVPFLWMLPLGVYLATFVLCFGSERIYRRLPYFLIAGTPLIAQSLIRVFGAEIDPATVAITNSIQLQIAIHVLVLFGACMVLHGELYRLRPAASSLTTFYLCLSAGGALGGIFVGAFAPRIFDDYRELEVGLALAWLLLLAACWQDTRGWLSPAAPHRRWALALALAATPLGWAVSSTLRGSTETVYQERSFFGVLRVWSIGSGPGRQRQLWNGSTLHGVQFPNEPLRPTSYYGVQTGIGLALGQREPASPVAIGVVGLGIGTLAAYGQPGDRFRFYEIDPAVIRLTRNERYFTYLAQSRAEVEVIEGDARISLASELARGELSEFDFLIVDAFSSDAIPVHLLTREALAVYRDALKEEGLLAMHVSNRHFDLVPVLARLGDDAGLRVASIQTQQIQGHLSAPSEWVFLARSEERIRSLVRLAIARRTKLRLAPDAIQVRRPLPEVVAKAPLWTDDYSDLLGSLKPLSPILSRFGARAPDPSPEAEAPVRPGAPSG